MPILARIEAGLGALRRELPRARQLPAQTAPFVDRARELEAAEEALRATPGVHGALVICCCGMPGVGKSALALELAHRQSGEFVGGWLYIDMRTPAGEPRTAEDAAARLLVDLGVAPDVIPQGPDARLGALRAALAEEPVLLVLDNASDETHVRGLIPSRSDSVVIVTSQASLAGIGTVHAIEVAEMGDSDARLMLETLIGERLEAEPEAANELIARAAGLPLAIAVVSGRARRRPTEPIAELVRTMSMTHDEIVAMDDRLSTLGGALSAGIAGLSPAARRLFVLICGLELPNPTPESAVVVGGMDLSAAARLLEELGDQRVLMPRAGGGWRVHQLLRSVGARIARDEYSDDLASAQRRRVDWLARSARALSDELEGEV